MPSSRPSLPGGTGERGDVARSPAARVVSLAPQAAAAFREQLVARPRGTTLVFPTPTGLRWDRNRLMGRHFRPATVAAGLQGVTMHDLRHTYASLMVRAGVDPLTIAQQMGHRDARLVLARYGH